MPEILPTDAAIAGMLRGLIAAEVAKQLSAVKSDAPTPRGYRIAKGYTIGELSQRAGVSTGFICKLERGAARRPQIGLLNKLARALAVPEQEFRATVAAHLERGCVQ